MKSAIQKRLMKLEAAVENNKRLRSKSALVICDPDIIHSHDFSFIAADHLIILPDNGYRAPEDEPIPKGSYVIRYLSSW